MIDSGTGIGKGQWDSMCLEASGTCLCLPAEEKGGWKGGENECSLL